MDLCDDSKDSQCIVIMGARLNDHARKLEVAKQTHGGGATNIYKASS